MTFPPPNKVAVVTGGARGLGLLTARRLVERGHFVIITSRRHREGATVGCQKYSQPMSVQYVIICYGTLLK